MKNIFLVAILCTFLTSFTFKKDDVFKIKQFHISLKKNEFAKISNEKTYYSSIKYEILKNQYIIKSDSFDIKFHIIGVKNLYSKTTDNKIVHNMTRYRVVKADSKHSYTITEILSNGKFSIIIMPIRFNEKFDINENAILIEQP